MKHVKNILVFVALWSITYYYGSTLGAAYDGYTDYKDLLAIISGFSGLIWLYSKYGK